MYVPLKYLAVLSVVLVFDLTSLGGGWEGGGESGLQSAFNHSWSYHRLQVGFGGVCRCMRGDF